MSGPTSLSMVRLGDTGTLASQGCTVHREPHYCMCWYILGPPPPQVL